MRNDIFLLFIFGVVSLWGGDSLELIFPHSEIKDAQLESVVQGEIISSRGSLMDFQRGISAQTLYYVKLSPSKTIELILSWNPALHESLGMYQHCQIQLPLQMGDFEPLNLRKDKFSVKWLMVKTASTTSNRSELQLSRSDMAFIEKEMHGSSNLETIQNCWKKILFNHVAKFQQAEPSRTFVYESGGVAISPMTEVRSLLTEMPKVSVTFEPVLTLLGLSGLDSKMGNSSPLQYYWELFDVEDHLTFGLGCMASKEGENHSLVADFEYFSTGGFYVSLILYDVCAYKEGTLIHRTDLISAPSLAITRGIERVAFGKLMVKEIKKAVQAFQADSRK